MTTGGLILLASVLLAAGLGAYRVSRDGRFRGTHRVAGVDESSPVPASVTVLEPLVPDDRLGERATLLQFSSAFCAPCRATRRILTEVSELVPGVAHVEVDAEQHLDLVRRLDIRKTPTTLVLDAHVREVKRAAGQPRKADVLAALGHAVP